MRGVKRRVWIGDGGFVGFFMVVCGGLRWWDCTLQWVSDFFFFHFTLLQTLYNIFQTIFQNATKHKKKNYFF